MDTSDDKHIDEVLKFFYAHHAAGKLNDSRRKLAAQVLHSALEKSHALDFVPRPPMGVPSVGWLVTEAMKTFWRTQRKQRIYTIAKWAAAWQYRSMYEMGQYEEDSAAMTTP